MSITHVENAIAVLPISDIERSIRFYVDLLGFTLDWQTGETASVSRDGNAIMLDKREIGTEPSWVWIGITDYSLFDVYKARDVEVYQEPRNHTWAYEMKFADLDGNVLWLGTETRSDLPLDD